ncbi:hypothetical protein HYN04_07570 [Phenylobacterium parvum]|uniref:GIY-YIG catalytic domain-containing protein n=1 Tax=Phenylobacterium parvum TaxID=2201350 RepID=A0A2Z3I1I0_9CAUL|nr:hypothetical protein HYN04_07570 [Phenylobacterium parvum]
MEPGALLRPAYLFSRDEVLGSDCPVPRDRGVYAWWFREPPPQVLTSGCLVMDGLTLLYIGISPKNETSRQTLRSRLRYHFSGNAEGSTLRLSLGVLLEDLSGFPLRRVGSGRRMTLTHLGEQWLDRWLQENARVSWVTDRLPWALEKELLERVPVPLNLQGNEHHPFFEVLSERRRLAKTAARLSAIAAEGNQSRS